jgi:dipeptidyl aminopeptidase/acylaminoacyl peptidase
MKISSNIGAWDAWYLGGHPDDGTVAYRDRSPVFLADRVKTPTLLTAGTDDRCTPPRQAIEFHRALLRRGVPTDSRSTRARVTASGSSRRTSTS